jgi:hypothetical protein
MMNPGSHGPDRTVEDLRDLVVGHLLEEAQQQDFLVQRPERAQAAMELGGILELQRLSLWIVRSLHRFAQLRTLLAPPKFRVHAVSGDPIEPDGESLGIGERMNSANDRQPRLLKQLIGQVRVVGELALDQFRQSLAIPKLATHDEHVLSQFVTRLRHGLSI